MAVFKCFPSMLILVVKVCVQAAGRCINIRTKNIVIIKGKMPWCEQRKNKKILIAIWFICLLIDYAITFP